uniref:Leucine rich repeat containing 34 n=1 Tax=Sinocyclocheilus rhinocerous TaxID=307959 RepID=A0A673MHC2_9TELE
MLSGNMLEQTNQSEILTEHFRYSLTIYYKKNLLSLLQMDAMTEVLSNSDEVEQLILRNTGLTDELLKSLATVLKRSPSEVTVINLNLNQIGPPGVNVLLDLLLLQIIMNNEVQTLIVIKELDLGGNGIGSDGLRVLATFMRYHSHLQYLGLAQTPCSDMEAWKVLFESLKMNTALTHIILDESNLGDNVIKLFAEALRSNKTLRKVDLDNNCFGEVGGHYLLEALRSGGKCSLEHLSLEVNYISTALMANIQERTLWLACVWLPIILNELLYSVIHLLGSLNSGGKTSEKYLLGLLTRSLRHKPTDSPTHVFEVCELSVHGR